jgi:hypothetical protein
MENDRDIRNRTPGCADLTDFRGYILKFIRVNPLNPRVPASYFFILFEMLYALSKDFAITNLWISLVPSPIVQSFESRQYFSAG